MIISLTTIILIYSIQLDVLHQETVLTKDMLHGRISTKIKICGVLTEKKELVWIWGLILRLRDLSWMNWRRRVSHTTGVTVIKVIIGGPITAWRVTGIKSSMQWRFATIWRAFLAGRERSVMLNVLANLLSFKVCLTIMKPKKKLVDRKLSSLNPIY